jgi:invasion protein IalB
MSIRRRAAPLALSALTFLSPGNVLAQAPAAPPPAAPPPAPPAEGQQQPPSQFSITQNVGDWTVRCVLETVKSPAPCDMLQVGVDSNTKVTRTTFSLAYVPSRDAYAMQVMVPPAVSLTRGLVIAAGARSLNGAKFTRCEREGCFVELLTDAAFLTALEGVGKTTKMTYVNYGPDATPRDIPVSLTGFPEALDRMKTLAKARAVALPPPPAATAPAAAAPARPAAAPAARPAPARPAAKAAPAIPATPAAPATPGP